MPKLITNCITQEQQDQLEQIRDTDKRPYMRERAAAMLKIAEGTTPRQVALNGLLKPRDPDAVYDWVHRYEQEGVAGLPIKPGRGRKPGMRLRNMLCCIRMNSPSIVNLLSPGIMNRWVRQSVLHLHKLSDDCSELKQRIRDFILSFRKGSNELLRYVGLLPD